MQRLRQRARTPAMLGWALWCLGACGSRDLAIGGVEPRRGHVEGGDTLRIDGSGFLGHGAPVVYLGTVHALGVVVYGDRRIHVVTPKVDAPGEVDLEIRFDDGARAVLPAAFVYEAGPRSLRLGATGGG